MSRRREAEREMEEIRKGADHAGDIMSQQGGLICTLANEVDAREEAITKLLALVKPIIQPSKTYPTSHGYESDCRKYVTLSTIYALACEIAGRTE